MPDEQAGSQPLTVAELCARYGMTLTVDTFGPRWSSCPLCGVATERNQAGQRCLCLPCTQRDIGEYADELAVRVTHGLTRKQWLALPRDDNDRPVPLPISRERQRKRR